MVDKNIVFKRMLTEIPLMPAQKEKKNPVVEAGTEKLINCKKKMTAKMNAKSTAFRKLMYISSSTSHLSEDTSLSICRGVQAWRKIYSMDKGISTHRLFHATFVT